MQVANRLKYTAVLAKCMPTYNRKNMNTRVQHAGTIVKMKAGYPTLHLILLCVSFSLSPLLYISLSSNVMCILPVHLTYKRIPLQINTLFPFAQTSRIVIS